MTPGDELREQLDLDVVPTTVPRFNIAPSQPLAIIKTPRILSFAAFGLSAVAGKKGRTINLRSESLPNMSAYREAFTQRRCLVVVDGFFEWLPIQGTSGKPEKQAFHIRREDGKPFTLAGVWAPRPAATPANDDAAECAIVTGAAAGVVAELHHRMPVIVAPEARALWLSDAPADRNQAKALMSRDEITRGAKSLVAIPVSARVNSAAHDDEEVLRPADDARRV